MTFPIENMTDEELIKFVEDSLGSTSVETELARRLENALKELEEQDKVFWRPPQ